MAMDTSTADEQKQVFLYGKFEEVVPKFQLETIKHLDEVIADCLTKEEASHGFITADMAVSYIADGKAMLGLARGHSNIIFQNLPGSLEELWETQNYTLNREQKESVVSSNGFFSVDMSSLKLRDTGEIGRCFYYGLTDFEKELNEKGMEFAVRLFGTGADLPKHEKLKAGFAGVMQFARWQGRKSVYVNMFGPEYVREHAPENGAIAFLCRIYASENDVNIWLCSSAPAVEAVTMRGILREDAPYRN